MVYEWIQLKGQGAMSSSKGVVVTAVEMLEITPPEVLRFLIYKHNPNKHLDFDPGLGILNLVDDYDRYERMYFTGEGAEEGRAAEKVDDWKRVYELSQPSGVEGAMPVQVPYRHFVSLVQITEDWEEMLETLKRTGQIEALQKGDAEHLGQRVDCVRSWLERFAPDAVKFSVQKEMPDVELDDAQRGYLAALAGRLETMEWKAERIHTAVHDAAADTGFSKKGAFKVLYQIMIGKPRGPRIGYFFSTLDRDFVIGRIREGAER